MKKSGPEANSGKSMGLPESSSTRPGHRRIMSLVDFLRVPRISENSQPALLHCPRSRIEALP